MKNYLLTQEKLSSGMKNMKAKARDRWRGEKIRELGRPGRQL